jgi:uncharacterized protein YchJ
MKEIGIAAHIGAGKVTTTERLMMQVNEMDNVVIVDEAQENLFMVEPFPTVYELKNYYEKLPEISPYICEPQTPKKWRNGINVPVQPKQTIGRNSPCSCGSGKKFKRCCGK